jgi:hypothetical protein
MLGGASPTLPSESVVKVWEPVPTRDGFQMLAAEMADGEEIVLVADEFKLVP